MRFLSRNIALAAVVSSTATKSLESMAAVTRPLPPLQAKIGLLSEPSSATSCVRPERIGPTGSAPLLWNTAANRVSSSTFSSYTRSASSRPLCGRASGLLSIFTTSAGRFAAAGSNRGRPVSGYVGATGTVVVAWSVPVVAPLASVFAVEAAVDVEDADAVLLVASATVPGVLVRADFESELHAAASRPTTTTTVARRIRRGLRDRARVDRGIMVTTPGAVRCALRAADGCRTSGAGGRGAHRRRRRTSVARSTDAPSPWWTNG